MKGKHAVETEPNLIIIILVLISIALFNAMGIFAVSRFAKTECKEVVVNFNDTRIPESDITYIPATLKTKSVDVTIAPQPRGTIQYKIGSTGTWKNYTGTFTCDQKELYTRLSFSDGLGVERKTQISNIVEEPRLIINGQYTIVKSGLQLQLDGANNSGEGHFDDRTIWRDISGNSRYGSITGATWNINNLEFDGVDDIMSLGLINNSYQTTEVNFSATADMNDSTKHVVIGNSENGGGCIYIYQGKIYGGYYINGEYRDLDSQINIQVNQNYNVSLTYDGSIERLYVNGIEVATNVISGTIGSSAENYKVGERFKGKIYSARVYNRALNKNEIKQNYQSDQILVNGYVNSGEIDYSLVWDEEVADFTIGDINLVNGDKVILTEVDGQKGYKLTVLVPTTGILENERMSLSVPANACVDINGVYNIASDTNNLVPGIARKTADGEVRNYANLQNAMYGAYTATVELIYGEVNESITIGSGLNITLDLNGNTLKTENNTAITNNGTLTIKESAGRIISTGVDAIVNTGTLILGTDDGNVSTTSPSIEGGNYGIYSYGTVNFYDGEIKGATGNSIYSPTLNLAVGCTKKIIPGIGVETSILEPKEVSITIDLNGGTLDDLPNVSTTIEAYGSKKAMGTPTKAGYTFGGWVPTKQLQLDEDKSWGSPVTTTWIEVFYHYSDRGNVLFNSDAEVLSANDLYKYSILNQLDSFENNSLLSNKFEFLLDYDDNDGETELKGKYNRWKQDFNPKDRNSCAVGVWGVRTSWSNGWAGGLCKSSTNNTYLDGSIRLNSEWYFAIGSKAVYSSGGLTGSNGPSGKVIKNGTYLWVKANNDLSNITTPIYGVLDNDGNYIVKHDIILKALWIQGSSPSTLSLAPTSMSLSIEPEIENSSKNSLLSSTILNTNKSIENNVDVNILEEDEEEIEEDIKAQASERPKENINLVGTTLDTSIIEKELIEDEKTKEETIEEIENNTEELEGDNIDIINKPDDEEEIEELISDIKTEEIENTKNLGTQIDLTEYKLKSNETIEINENLATGNVENLNEN